MWWLLYFITKNLTTIFVSVVGLLLMVSYFKGKKKYRLPPGPPNLPLIGSLPFLGTDPREPLIKMSKKYGDMVTVYLGSTPTVYLNSYDVIKEAFANSGLAFAGRPQFMFSFRDICKGIGIISSEGELWKEQRRFTHTVLKDLGIGRVMMEPKIQQEVEYYIAELETAKGKPVVPNFLTTMALSNIIYSIVNGKRFDYEEPSFKKYVIDLNFAFTVLKMSGVVMVFPFLRYLPGDPFHFKRILQDVEWNTLRFQQKIDDHRQNYDPTNPRDFIDIYLKQMDTQEKTHETTTFSDGQLIQTIGDLFGAGAETTASTVVWFWIYMLNYPDVMRRCQEEIDDVMGRHRAPVFKDKLTMPYVHATILEITRMIAVVPFSVPHTVPEDVEFRGYHFPAGTIVWSNIYAVSYDEQTWPEPYCFRPERHITPDGKVAKKDQHIQFGIGRRVCIGESLAKVELFLFFTSVLQKYDIVLPEGEPLPTLVGEIGATHVPPRCRMVFRERN